MKPLHGDTVSNDSCSCTSCDYQSESDRQSLRRLLAQSSRINRLFYGRYIPLRESKLLDKLVRTRALYDALRSQLLSSSISVSSKADLKKRQSPIENRKALEEAKKSSDIFSLVDLVDKGAVLGSRKLSECCSCCNCNSKARLHENVPKGRRNRQSHAGGNITSRSSVSKQGNSEESRLGNKIKAKNIKSDPCSCACKLRGLIKLQSRVMLKKIRPEQPIIERDRILKATDKHKYTALNNEKLRKSYHKLKRSKAHPIQYIENMGEGGGRIIRNPKQQFPEISEVRKMKSIEQLNIAEQKIKDSFIADKKTLLKSKAEEASWVRYNAEDNMFRMKKESAIKGKDRIDNKRLLQDWELKHRIALSSRKNKLDKEDNKNNASSSTSDISVQKERNGIPIKTTNQQQRSPSRQRNIKAAMAEPQTNEDIPKKFNESRHIADSNERRKRKERGLPLVLKEKERSVKSMTNLPSITSANKGQNINKQLPFIKTNAKEPSKTKPIRSPGKLLKSVSTSSIERSTPVDTPDSNEIMTATKKSLIKLFNDYNKSILKSYTKDNKRKWFRSPERHPVPKDLVYKQHNKLGLETSGHEQPPHNKQKLMLKNIQAGSHTLKRCLCSLKIKVKKTKSKIHKNVSKEFLRKRDSQSFLPSDRKSSKKSINTKSDSDTRYNLTHKSSHVSQCECSNFITNTDEEPPLTLTSKLSKCECSETDKGAKNKYVTKNKSSEINTQSEKASLKPGRLDSKMNVKEKPAIKHEIGSIKTHSKTKSTSKHVSKCECPVIKNTTEEQQAVQYAYLSESLHKIKSACECECSESNISKEKRSKYKSSKTTNTQSEAKPNSSHASNTIQPKIKNKNRAVQTHNKIASKEKRGIDIFSGPISTYRESKSISNHTPIYESPADNIAIKEKYIKQPKQRENNETSKPRFSAEIIRKELLTKNGSQVLHDADSKIKQDHVKRLYTSSVKTKHIRNKQSQISNSTRKSKYITNKHGLRNCLCTFKLGKLEKHKKNARHLRRTTRDSQTQLKVNNVSISTGKSQIYHSQIRHVITPKSVQLPRTSKIHSSLISHKSEIPAQRINTNKNNLSDTKQVRSSFASKYLKGKRSPLIAPITNGIKIKKESKTGASRNPKLDQDIESLRKSILIQIKKQQRSSLFGPAIKRCLCTLKFHKKEKNHKRNISINTNNMIVEKFYTDRQNAINRNGSDRHVRPSKDFGIVTQKTKMISKSSDTRKLGSTINLLLAKSDYKRQKSSLQMFKNMRKYSELGHPSRNLKEMYSEKSIKQAVRIGSNFSFNIEFFKDVITEEKQFNDLKNNHAFNNLTNKWYSDRNYSQRSTKVSPILKRCFCTLKLLKNDRRHQDSKLFTPFVIKKPTQVYAVSTITVAKTRMNSPEILLFNEVNLGSHCVDSYSYSKEAQRKTNQFQYFKQKSQPSVLISLSTIAFKSNKMHSYIRQSECKLLHKSPTTQNLLDINSKETVRFKSKFSCEINSLNLKNIRNRRQKILKSVHSQINPIAQRKEQNLEDQENVSAPNIVKGLTKSPQLTGIQPLLRRCYCTMNMQLAGHQSPRKRHHHHSPTKLKDYECEPGVCIPYECDPYECQKMIMKRLMKKVSKMSGTERRLRTSSSLTSSLSARSKTRKLQSSLAREQRRRAAKARPVGLKYQTLPRPPRTKRQAVRVGSAFSFDIEFSKGSKSAPTAEFIKVPKRPLTTKSSKTYDRRRRDRGTGYGVGRQHRESQSIMKQMRHRASSVSPMLKRCFCTLKLQKKGRMYKERESQGISQGTLTPPKFQVEKPILRTTETSQNTKIKRKYPELLPYECEPNICVPGECDPYACLELIKRRRGRQSKDFGTDSMISRITSSSSMTARQNRTKGRRIQSRNIRAYPVRSRDTAVRSKPSVMSIERPVTSSRQAVRIGSSFSFNVEFFKDKTSPHDIGRRSPEIYVHKSPKARKVPKGVYAQRARRDGYSQDGKSMRDTDSQIGIPKHGRSTMTGAFLRRCFCTAKLHGIKVDAETRTRPQFGGSISALKRCFCTLKSLTARKNYRKISNVGHERASPRLETHVIKTQTRGRSPVLGPYECEPGICVPGYCDPYECEKLIRKRRAKEKMAGTTGPRTKSTSSSFTSSKTSKAGMTQLRQAKHDERVRRRGRSPREMVVREKLKSPVLPHRQAVRIGSSFSFDIEFYKDKFPNYHQVQAAATTVKRTRPRRHHGQGSQYGTKTRERGLRGRGASLYSRESQVDPTKKIDKSFGPILRRCFCTLKLHKQRQAIKQAKREKLMRQQGTATPFIREVPTLHSRSVMTANRLKALPYKLEPYECEPGVCVPGECDPYECEKRIKRRLMNRGSGTLTDRRRTTSTSFTPRHRRRHRDSEAQSAIQRTKPRKIRDYQTKERRPEYRSTVVHGSSKQAVKIGSNFSFDVEFFKNKSPGGSVGSLRQYDSYDKPRKTSSRSTEGQSISYRNRRAQRSRGVRDMDSQVLARKMRSTMTGVGPFLKRCFCTLQLHKSEVEKRPFDLTQKIANKTDKSKTQAKIETGNTVKSKTEKIQPKMEATVKSKTEKSKILPKLEAGNLEKTTHTRKITQYHGRPLEPYECEPGVCIPGQCDPYECEKRIRRRMQSKQSSTEPHKGRSRSSSIGESTKSRPRRTQARSYTPRRAKTGRGDDQYRREEHIVYDTNSNRQAVRVGSSFSFNIEFYKDKSPQFPSVREVNNIVSRGIKGTETGLKRSRSMASYSKRARLRDCQSQSDCIKTECKASCSPLLKRCFCTLKLQKMGKQQQYTKIKIEPTTKSMGTRTSGKNKVEIIPVAREIGTKTKKYSHPLEPYECEPGVCVPGQCDPYECEKRIQRRNMKNFGAGTTHAPMKSMSNLTSMDKGTKAMNTQLRRERYDKGRQASTETIYRNKKNRQPSHPVENTNRQAVRLGSNFSFNIEFSKDKSSDLGGSYHNEVETNYKTSPMRSRKSKASVSTAYQIKHRNQGLHGMDRSLSHRQSQIGAEMESKGSGMGPLLKRCFCTLTLQRAEVKNTLKSPVAQSKTKQIKNSNVKTQDKKTSTKQKSSKPPAPVQQLEPDECEPNVCVPGECNPYECLERIKKRGIRRMSRTTGTRMKRTSQVSVSSMAAQFIPGYTSKRTQLKEGFHPQKVDRIVEEPRFQFLGGNSNRQGVRISSNFSFNIEFFKEALPAMMAEDVKTCPRKEICKAKDKCVECTKKGTFKSKIGQHVNESYLNSESQSDPVKTEDKSSAVAMLRRCFCTAKLHKSHLAQSQHPQALTVGRVEEVRPSSFFGPKEYWVQYQIQQPNLCKPCKLIKYPKDKENIDSNKLETIMSYTPSKFNKNNDPRSCIKKPNNTCCSTCRCNRKYCQLHSHTTHELQKHSAGKHSTLTKMLCVCKHLFSKLSKQQQDDNKMFDENENNSKIQRVDFLKHSKSERRPKNITTAGTKKSTSQKEKRFFSHFQSGDAGQGYNVTNKQQKNGINFVTKICPHCQIQFKQAVPKNKQVRFAFMRNDESLQPTDIKITEQERESTPLSFLFKGPKFRESQEVKSLKLCSCCGGLKRKRTLPSPCVDQFSKQLILKQTKPVLPEEKPSCTCCVCKKKNKSKIKAKSRAKLKRGKKRPCVCGSIACKEEVERQAEQLKSEYRRNKIKTCVCGTRICAAESRKEAFAKESAYKRARKKKKREKKLDKELKIREKQYKAEDKALAEKRRLDDIYMMKKLQKYKDTPDSLLVAESILDISKLGLTSAGDIIRNLGRAVFDPRRTYKNMRLFIRDPMRAWKRFVDSANDSPGISTLKRLKYRCLAMTCVKQGREKLEEHPVTNFIVHSKDKDPKARLRPKIPKRRLRRPDTSFGCSPFMLSLRKRPWLSVYYKCAWFYPHCLSILTVWKQFMDILLFLLAVAVWSPCIVGMELCRALMCCFLCTG